MTMIVRLFNYITTPEQSHAYTAELFDLVERGAVKVHVHKVYPFTVEDAKQTHIDITGRGTMGKLIVKISD